MTSVVQQQRDRHKGTTDPGSGGFGDKEPLQQNRASLNRYCKRSHNRRFVREMTVHVRPRSWAQGCRRLLVKPHVTSEMFEVQRSPGLGLQVLLTIPKALATHQSGETVSYGAPAFGWSPACRDDGGTSVTWKWKIFRFADGKKLELNKLRWGSIPQNGFEGGFIQMPPGSFQAQASWELPIDENQLQQLGFDIKVNLRTAVLPKSKYFPVYRVKKGPSFTFEGAVAL